MMSFAGAIALMAVLGAPHCVGMCGGIAAAASQGGSLPYQAGRISTYVGLGIVAGAAGRWLPGPSWFSLGVCAVLLVAMSASLAGWLPELAVRVPGLTALMKRVSMPRGPVGSLALGLLNGLLPCGLLWGALAVPVSTGSALQGALLMGLFGVLTAVPLTVGAVSLRSLIRRRPGLRPWMAGLVLVAGLGGLWLRVPTGDPSPTCHCAEEAP